jgi:hypothetical protein
MTDNKPDPMVESMGRHRSLAILRALHKVPGMGVNHLVLDEYLALICLACSRDELTAARHLLKEKGAVGLSERQGIVLIELTERGVELATGKMVEEDWLLRPGPGCLS